LSPCRLAGRRHRRPGRPRGPLAEGTASTTASSSTASWALAADRPMASPMPPRSTRRWYLCQACRGLAVRAGQAAPAWRLRSPSPGRSLTSPTRLGGRSSSSSKWWNCCPTAARCQSPSGCGSSGGPAARHGPPARWPGRPRAGGQTARPRIVRGGRQASAVGLVPGRILRHQHRHPTDQHPPRQRAPSAKARTDHIRPTTPPTHSHRTRWMWGRRRTGQWGGLQSAVLSASTVRSGADSTEPTDMDHSGSSDSPSDGGQVIQVIVEQVELVTRRCASDATRLCDVSRTAVARLSQWRSPSGDWMTQ
jgi:hypothetical protein